MIEILERPLGEAALIQPRVHGDDRGFFLESWNSRAFAAAGLDVAFVQDNHSRSARGVLRGLHFQNPDPQGKLVRVVAGAVFDTIVDLRRSSPTFGKWYGVELSAQNKLMLWVPPGFAHGFLTLEDSTDFQYKCTAFYDPSAEHTLQWNDPELAIDWPLGGLEAVLSDKDRKGRPLRQIETFA